MSDTTYPPITNDDASLAVDAGRQPALGTPDPTQSLTKSDNDPTTSDTTSDTHPTPSDIATEAAGDANPQDAAPLPSPAATPTMSGPVPVCEHIREDGVFCQRPALHQRHYCYQHLRLRGQQMRMARALALRQPYRLTLPPLDDLQGVQAALEQVTRAMGLGLLEQRRAGMLLYALRQASCNLRFLAQAESKSARSFQAGEKAGTSPPAVTSSETAGQLRLVEEYPGFEAEFGLPPGLDLSLPPDVAVAVPDPGWTTAATPAASGAFHSDRRWTKLDMEREELEKKYEESGGAECYAKQIRKMNAQVEKEVHAEFRKQQEAEWEAQAERRNAAEAEKAREWQSMDPAQQRAFLLGKLEGFAAGQRAAEEELARAKKPAAAAAAQTPVEPSAAEPGRA